MLLQAHRTQTHVTDRHRTADPPPPSAPRSPDPFEYVVGRHQALRNAVDALAPVDLAHLDEAQLHDRVESKMILRMADVPHALLALAGDYLILEHRGERLQGYRTDYFDSPDLRNYHEHHNQKGRRLKLRYRTYLNSDLTFFEVKRKLNGRTVKERQISERPEGWLWPEDALFFFRQTRWDPDSLVRSLRVDYDRILLVKRDFSERVTIDLNMEFTSARGATEARDLAICEFKQPKLNLRSPAMRATNRRPQDFSKYCIGLASCDPSLRRNRFKKVFHSLDVLNAGLTSREQVAR